MVAVTGSSRIKRARSAAARIRNVTTELTPLLADVVLTGRVVDVERRAHLAAVLGEILGDVAMLADGLDLELDIDTNHRPRPRRTGARP